MTSSNTDTHIPTYTAEELHSALLSLTVATTAAASPSDPSVSPNESCGHLYGYDVTHSCFDPNHTLSMLQIITAHRILSYQQKLLAMNENLHETESLLLNQMKQFRQEHGPVFNLLHVIQAQSPAMALAAEFKRASPSKGMIASSSSLPIEDPVELYADAGACIISVLTEPTWFHGSLSDLTRARIHTSSRNNKATTRPAILRKDFIISRYMILEAAASGADTVLLIVAITPLHLLQDWIHYSRTVCHMEPLVEVHTLQELYIALQADAKVIGVNNRNLHTFQLDLSTTDRMAAAMKERNCLFDPRDITKPSYALCALSGMSTAQDVDRYRQQGVSMCLIGESLMRASDPKAAIVSLWLHPLDYSNQSQKKMNHPLASYTAGTQMIKVCGITNPEDALWACQCGANMIGIIFVPLSKRCVVDLERAKDIVHAVRTFGEREQRVEFPCTLDDNGSSSSSSPLEVIRRNTRALEDVARKRPLVVGVFQNQEESFIRHVVQECGLDLIQLHGQEGMEACSRQRCIVPAIRVMDIEASSSEESKQSNRDEIVETLIQSITCDPFIVLLDTTIKGSTQGGGTGMTFDWSIAEAVQNRGLPVLIAGGLKPDNIYDAVKTIRPWGVDVSSGVECSPGKKDRTSVQSFVASARNAALEANKGF